jgi:hypothetical protein
MMQRFIVTFFKLRAVEGVRRRMRVSRRRVGCLVCSKRFAARPGETICGPCRADIDARAAALSSGASEAR